MIARDLAAAAVWQADQSRLMAEVRAELKTIALQTAERRGSAKARAAIVAGALAGAGVFLTIIGLALNALGVFG